MRNGIDGPRTADALIAEAIDLDRARHLLALYLGRPRAEIEADVPAALQLALGRLPTKGPLRREKDRRILRAFRMLVEALPEEEPLRKRLRWLMEEAEWRARLGKR